MQRGHRPQRAWDDSLRAESVYTRHCAVLSLLTKPAGCSCVLPQPSAPAWQAPTGSRPSQPDLALRPACHRAGASCLRADVRQRQSAEAGTGAAPPAPAHAQAHARRMRGSHPDRASSHHPPAAPPKGCRASLRQGSTQSSLCACRLRRPQLTARVQPTELCCRQPGAEIGPALPDQPVPREQSKAALLHQSARFRHRRPLIPPAGAADHVSDVLRGRRGQKGLHPPGLTQCGTRVELPRQQGPEAGLVCRKQRLTARPPSQPTQRASPRTTSSPGSAWSASGASSCCPPSSQPSSCDWWAWCVCSSQP